MIFNLKCNIQDHDEENAQKIIQPVINRYIVSNGYTYIKIIFF